MKEKKKCYKRLYTVETPGIRCRRTEYGFTFITLNRDGQRPSIADTRYPLAGIRRVRSKKIKCEPH
jgi:hypothetical protein